MDIHRILRCMGVQTACEHKAKYLKKYNAEKESRPKVFCALWGSVN